MAERKLSILVVGDASKAKKELAGLDKSLGKTEKQAKKSGDGIKSSIVGFGLGAAAFGAVKAFDDASKVMAQSEAVIKSTGGAANVTADQMANLAGELSKKTGIDDEAIQSGENLIATFTGIRNEAGKGNDVFDQTTRAALDMSVALGTDMTSSAQMLGKALNDPVAGLSKLSRAGVVFTDQQKEQIRTLAESGDKLGAQKIMLAELEKEFGGSAEAQATSLGKSKVAIDNLAESLGGVLMPVVTVAADALGGLASAMGALPQPVQTVAVLAGAGAVAWVKWGDSIGSALGSLGGATKKLDGFRLGLLGVTQAGAGASNKVGGFVAKMGGLPAVATFGGIATAGLGAAVLGFTMEADKAAARAAEFKAAIKGISTEALNTGKSVKDVFNETVIPDLVGDAPEEFKKFGIDVKDLSAAVTGGEKEWQKYRAATLEANGETASAATGMTSLELGLDNLRGKYEGSTASVKAQRAAQDELGTSTDEATAATEAATVASLDSRSAAERQADGLAAVADAADKARQAITDFYDATTAQLDANIGAEAALDALTASVVENGTSLDINTEKGRNNLQTFTAMKDAASEASVAILENGGSAWDAAGKMSEYAERMREAARDAGYSEDQVNLMIGAMKLTPKDIRTQFIDNSPSAKSRTKDLISSINRTPSSKHTTFNTSVTGLSAVNIALDNAARTRQARINVTMGVIQNNTGMSTGQIFGSARASGGPVAPGQPYLVGEEGPELVTFGQKGMVHDASATKSMMTGGGSGMVSAASGGATYISVVVQGQVVTQERLVDGIIKGINERQGRSSRPVLAGVS